MGDRMTTKRRGKPGRPRLHSEDSVRVEGRVAPDLAAALELMLAETGMSKSHAIEAGLFRYLGDLGYLEDPDAELVPERPVEEVKVREGIL